MPWFPKWARNWWVRRGSLNSLSVAFTRCFRKRTKLPFCEQTRSKAKVESSWSLTVKSERFEDTLQDLLDNYVARTRPEDNLQEGRKNHSWWRFKSGSLANQRHRYKKVSFAFQIKIISSCLHGLSKRWQYDLGIARCLLLQPFGPQVSNASCVVWTDPSPDWKCHTFAFSIQSSIVKGKSTFSRFETKEDYGLESIESRWVTWQRFRILLLVPVDTEGALYTTPDLHIRS